MIVHKEISVFTGRLYVGAPALCCMQFNADGAFAATGSFILEHVNCTVFGCTDRSEIWLLVQPVALEATQFDFAKWHWRLRTECLLSVISHLYFYELKGEIR